MAAENEEVNVEAAVTFPLLLTENPSGISLVPTMSAFVAVPPTTPPSLS